MSILCRFQFAQLIVPYLDVDVITIKGRQNRYFIGSRSFELAEIRLLIDAVSSCRFITARKSTALIQKLKSLTSRHAAANLEQHLHIAEQIKSTNESVFYTVDAITNAIYSGHKITFPYLEYRQDKQISYKHDGKRYTFSPYDVIWNDGRYYAVGYSEDRARIVTFRIDRMKNVEDTGKEAVPRPAGYSILPYTSEVFEMFAGEKTTVELACANELMKVIIDRFGEDVQTERIDDEYFKATVTVSVSPTFFGWILQFSGRIKILSPATVKEQMIHICQEVNS